MPGAADAILRDLDRLGLHWDEAVVYQSERGAHYRAALEHLRIEGLMSIPPPAADAEGSRQWFRRLRELRDELFARPAWAGRAGLLSMGLSSDFEVAIEEGATHVRVGSALFGPRPLP